MPLGLGITKGASFVNDWDKDIDRLYQREEYAANVHYQKEQKTRYFAEQIKRGHGSNPRTEADLNEFYKGLNSELADFVTENPNFETDVNAMQKFLDISDRYLNNGILQQDMQVKQEFDKLRQAVSDEKITRTKYEEEMARYNEYIDPVKKGDPYVFTNFKEIDGSEYLTTLSKTLGKVQGESYTDKLSGDVMQDVTIPKEKIEQQIELDYNSDEDVKLMMDNEYKKFVAENPSEAKTINTPTALFKKRFNAYNSVEKVNLGLSYAKQMALRESSNSKGETPFSTFMNNEAPMIQSAIAGGGFQEGSKNEKYYAAPHIIANTKIGSFKTPTTINPSDGILAIKETEDGVQTTSEWKDNARIIATNATEWVYKGGFLYAKVSVTMQNGGVIKSIASEDENKNQNTVDQKRLEDLYGFKIIGTQTDAMMEEGSMSMNKSYSSSPTYQGTLLIPARVDPATVGAYEKEVTGTERSGKTNPYVAENWDNFISQFPELMKSGSIAMNPTLFNQKVREITSKMNGESNPEKVGEFVYDNLGWILPKDAKNFRYDPRYGYPVFERSDGKLYTKRRETGSNVFTVVPDIVSKES